MALAAPLADVRALADEPGFAPLAARRVILAALQAAGGDVDRLASLDRLHALAVEQSVVTPYSSMIVLVDDVQARRLDELEGKADRFAREVEGVGETETPLAVTGVPEPEAWLLLALAAAMLAVKARQRVRTASRGEA
ncbi:MAG: PEP-CTERM sorting domain-containing protein [Chloroflexi bacterium CFX6]|nr:PEP-CTERM sorting domain-containing protein [Chloroflexi bacterium CFX6]